MTKVALPFFFYVWHLVIFAHQRHRKRCGESWRNYKGRLCFVACFPSDFRFCYHLPTAKYQPVWWVGIHFNRRKLEKLVWTHLLINVLLFFVYILYSFLFDHTNKTSTKWSHDLLEQSLTISGTSQHISVGNCIISNDC